MTYTTGHSHMNERRVLFTPIVVYILIYPISLRYSLFGLLGNLGPIASGQTMVAVRNWLTINRGLSDEKAFESSIKVPSFFHSSNYCGVVW